MQTDTEINLKCVHFVHTVQSTITVVLLFYERLSLTVY